MVSRGAESKSLAPQDGPAIALALPGAGMAGKTGVGWQ